MPDCPPRKPTNLSLDPALLLEARSFGINLSQAAEAGLRRTVAEALAARERRGSCQFERLDQDAGPAA